MVKTTVQVCTRGRGCEYLGKNIGNLAKSLDSECPINLYHNASPATGIICYTFNQHLIAILKDLYQKIMIQTIGCLENEIFSVRLLGILVPFSRFLGIASF